MDKAADKVEEVLLSIRQEAHLLRLARVQHQNSLRPAVALPSELLGMIFALVCLESLQYDPQFDDEYRWESAVDRRSRTGIISTCHRWCQVALATPLLWSRIFIGTGVEYNDVSDSDGNVEPTYFVEPPNISVLLLELERSGACQLDIIVAERQDLYEDGGNHLFPLWTSMVRALSEVMDRWKTVRIEAPLPLSDLLFDEALPSQVESFIHYSPDRGSFSLSNAMDISLAQSLRQIWINTPFGVYTPDDDVNFHRLEKLCLSPTMHHADVIQVLECCPELRQLTWNPVNRKGKAHEASLERHHFPKLQQLYTSPAVAHSLRAPQLRRLRLSPSPNTSETVLSPPSHFPLLRVLDLSDVTEMFTIMFSMERLPELEELILPHDRHLSTIIVDELHRRDSNGGFERMPHLRLVGGGNLLTEQAVLLLERRNEEVEGETRIPFSIRYSLSADSLLRFHKDKFTRLLSHPGYIRETVEDPFTYDCFNFDI